MTTADSWIKHLNLTRHPEGGYYVETYHAAESIDASALPARFTGTRIFSTAIYFLLESGSPSHFHRLKSDELWHFYTGSAITLHLLGDDGVHAQLHLGPHIEKGQAFQAVLPAGCWFGARVAEANSYSLVGCTVAPGFHFDDFELAQRDDLLQSHPAQRAIIEQLTRPTGEYDDSKT